MSFTLWVLYSAFIASLFAFFVVVLMLTGNRPPTDVPLGPLLPILMVMSGLTMLAIVALRKLMKPPLKAAETLNEEPLDDIPEEARTATDKLFLMNLFSWVLCESIAIYGVVLTLVTMDITYFLGFGLASVANFVFYAPSSSMVRDAVRATTTSPEGDAPGQ